MSSYSLDLRERVLKVSDAEMLTRQVAEKYQVSPHVGPSAQSATTTSTVYAQPIRELIQAQPDLTLVEIKVKLDLTLSLTTIWRVVRSLGLTMKTKSSTWPSKSEPTLPKNAGTYANRVRTPPGRSRPRRR
jgi:transposase